MNKGTRFGPGSIARIVIGGFILFLLIYFYMFAGARLMEACTPILIGLTIAYPLNMAIRWFERHDFLYNRKILKSRKVHHILCVAAATILLGIGLVFIFAFLAPQLTACIIALLDKVPSGIRELLQQPLVTQLIPKDTMETLQEVDWTNWINHMVSMINSDDLFRGMTSTATSALSVFSTILFGLLFAAYFLGGKERAVSVIKRMVRAFVPARRQDQVLRSGALLNDCFHDFFVCQGAQALIIGISATVLMMVFRFPYASMIGTLNGFCALVPIIGGYVGAILGTLMILADSPGMALFFLIFIIVLQNAIGTFVFPKLVGRTLGLPGVWTLGAVLIGSGLGGITGILLGVPLTAFGYRTVGERLKRREAEMAADGTMPETPPEAE
ncbi:MAG: AI-2E family transporter [Clostridia bacterium]|nr:AI-2E family transporter [Clostridia bacterium]